MRVLLKNITKDFDDVRAVDNLNVEIEEGKLVSLLGPSGCGKSTLLSLIAGLLNPTDGKIYFGDTLVNKVEPENREIGMVFQSYALYPHMDVLKNITFPLKMKKIPKKERIRLGEEMAELVHIKELLHRKPSQLSGGQQQRAAIARALIKKPKILLLDEPLSNLDARLRITMREEIRRIQKETGITTIFVTHDQEEAMSISDKILLLKDGKLQQYSIPRIMYNEPNNKFTAEFIGNPPINIMKFHRENDFIILEGSKVKIKVEEIELVKLCDEKGELGIRPEDLILVQVDNKNIKDFSREKLRYIYGKVDDIHPMGKEVYVKVNLGNKHITFITDWDSKIESGNNVVLEIKKIHIFK